MPTSCCAYNCSERSVPGGSVAFHRFPTKNEMLFRAWCVAIRRKDFHPTWASRVCSKHFTKDSYERGYPSRTLKKNAVPTIFDFKGTGTKKPNKLKKSSKTSKSHKSTPGRNKTVDSQGGEDTDTSSEMYSFQEKPNVEIIKLKRENTDEEESEKECEEERPETPEVRQKYEKTEGGVLVGVKIDSLPSDQCSNMVNENEILRQTIHYLSKKVERFKCLTNVLRSNELISEEAAEVLRCTIDM